MRNRHGAPPGPGAMALALLATFGAGCQDMGEWIQLDAGALADGGVAADGAAPAETPGDGSSGPEVSPNGVVRLVIMRDLTFREEGGGSLPPIQARVGDTLRFRNDEATYLRHNVQDGEVVGSTIPDAVRFRSDYIDPGQWFDYVIPAPGRFFFFCPIHVATMKNKEVAVE